MSIDDLKKLLLEKGYSKDLIEMAVSFYPIMCDYFGYENTIDFFKTYTLIPREHIGDNSSGATYKPEKKVVFDWQCKNLHEAITLFIHEAAHAIGSLSISSDHMLMEGAISLESFFSKLEEGLVSDKENEMKFGELSYEYQTINSYDDEEFHKNNFKSQSPKYTINGLYYRVFQLLLGPNSNLLFKNMFAKEVKEKEYYYNMAISFLKSQLSEEEFLIIKDCACVLTLNFPYSPGPMIPLQHNKEFNTMEGRIVYERVFPKNLLYARDRNLLDKSIFDSVNDLCYLALNVLIRRLNSSEYDGFSAIKEAATYLVKVANNDDKLQEKTHELKRILLMKISEKIPELANIDLEKCGLTEDDKITILTQIISLASFSRETFNKVVIEYYKDSLHISINNCENYMLKKEPIYSDDMDCIFALGSQKIIGYKIITTRCDDFFDVKTRSI